MDVRLYWLALFVCLGWGGAVFAQSPLIQSEDRRPLITIHRGSDGAEVVAAGSAGSLFVGRSGSSLLAPYPDRPKPVPNVAQNTLNRLMGVSPQLVALRELIADAEAGALDYNAVQYGARIKPNKPPTQMTLDEINAWIVATPGQPHAIGRYQFIPATLRRLVRSKAMPGSTVFTPDVQDALADILLDDAGLADFTAGRLPRHQFMNNLAKIWAGLPNATGRSHYHGYAGNKATLSWARFDQQMIAIFGA
jgi:muramidase (phage lysozyme)